MPDERSIELAVALLGPGTAELDEVLEIAEHWWPDASPRTLARAAAWWALDNGYATLDVGNYSEPDPVPSERWHAVLEDPSRWVSTQDRRTFLRPTPEGSELYHDKTRWPSGYRERVDRVTAELDALDLERLASELAARLAPAAPEGVFAKARGATLRISTDSAAAWFDLDEHRQFMGTDDVLVHGAIRSILAQVQVDFSEWQTMPWPTNAPSYLGSVFADPEAEMRDDVIEMWFGPEDQPALVLEPIRLVDIRRTSN